MKKMIQSEAVNEGGVEEQSMREIERLNLKIFNEQTSNGYEHYLQGLRSKYAGDYFETIISTACEYYRENDIADIEKTPEPMKPIKPYGERKSGKFIAVFEKKGQGDYKGILNGGRCIVFEAKHTEADKISKSVVKEHQERYLERYQKMGAVCFVLLSFAHKQFFRIPWNVWSDMKLIYGRKHLKREELKEYEVKCNHLGVLDFLMNMEV